MKKLLTINIILFSLILIACNSQSKQVESKEVNDKKEVSDKEEVEIPESFVNFYEQFHLDSAFQMRHIAFPVDGKSATEKWERETWRLHRPFDSQNGNYIRSFENIGGIIFETIVEKTGAYKIDRRYIPTNDTYNLTYYSAQSQMKGWDPSNN
ncbi:MAG: hypothetical protein HKO66_16535 [Saprospiraceae bacterium]|nr:DUF4348 domain-containing protein [Bacteroidia bacterium]NNE15997.1 hypothetical protein [Saprospiraceae bacterium]NNL93853.1 hypothetical protein [Saprospiraceae bacterium]